MDISKRLNRIIELVPPCTSIIDVGTDHGYVPIGVIKAGKVETAYASDFRLLPLKKAEANIRLEGLEDRIRTVHGSGLTTVSPGDVEGAVIAGMGGNLTRDIMEDSIDLVKSLRFLLLQPAQNPEVLRQYLYEGDYDILLEDLVKEEDGRFYEYILVRPHEGRAHEGVGKGTDEEPVPLCGYEVSPWLIRNGHPLLREYLDTRISEFHEIITKLATDSENAKSRKIELEEKIIKFKEIIRWLY